MNERFVRTELLLGAEAMNILNRAHVAVFGVGGVGGYVAEALARTGVGELTLVDADRVDITNLNRQIVAVTDTVGMPKVEAAKQRIRQISPDCAVHALAEFYLPQNADRFDLTAFDHVVDAVDTVSAKLHLAAECEKLGVPIVSCMGAGNKLDPGAFRVADIYETAVCPLARVMRNELRKLGVKHLKVVYSQEPPRTPLPMPDGDGEQGLLRKRVTPGSVAYVPAAAGLIAAGEVVKDLLGDVFPSARA